MSKKNTKQRSNNGAATTAPDSKFVDPSMAKAAAAQAIAVDGTIIPPKPDRPKPTRPVTPPEALADETAANRLAILESPSYLLAENDIDFLKRKENRPLRMQLELLKAETLLREHQIDATVVVCGGTQIMPHEQAEAVLREARLNAERSPGDPKIQRALRR